ncbi:MAG: hypothetical protein MJE63_20135 [Proteobacteria bacterium]|nr:hypothetical protein [Pseudomonadota bacterium]
MSNRFRSLLPACVVIFHLIWLLLLPSLLFATQTHKEPEGLFVHQAAHIFFIISMGIFAYRLKTSELIKQKGWRYIRIAALLLVAWNLDAFLVHFLDEQLYVLHIETVDRFHIKLTTIDGYGFLGILYYILKLDHLWCVPALAFLFLGLNRLAKEIELPDEKKEQL